jgi:hypothetical protein
MITRRNTAPEAETADVNIRLRVARLVAQWSGRNAPDAQPDPARIMGSRTASIRHPRYPDWMVKTLSLRFSMVRPSARLDAGPFWVFPWAIAMWTVQVFFFSAIFERIMQKD